MVVLITLNGTDVNPYHKLGLTRNPFPAIAEHGYAGANEAIADLAANPIRDLDDLRRRLAGCDQALIDLCCRQFRKGETVRFEIEFPE